MAIGINKTAGFYLNRKKPLDVKSQVANSTERLALTFVFKGLITNQKDDSKRYLYVGNETTNNSGDWIVVQQLYTGTVVPANTLGAIDDIYINETTKILYRKTGTTTWTALFTINGAQIYTSEGTPDNGIGLDGDINIEDIGNVYRKESGVWDLKFNIAGEDGVDGDRYATNSLTSINLGTATDPITFTVGLNLAYTIGQQIEIVSAANAANNITAEVASYNPGTGQLIVTNSTISGSGTHTDWQINLSGAPGKQGKAFIHTESDINLTQTKITSVQAGSWTPENPWSASILNDSRSAGELTSTPGIVGNKAGHSIAYNGTVWFDNGTWRGSTGATGATGGVGPTGAAGANGAPGLIPYEYVNIVAGDAPTTNISRADVKLLRIRAANGKRVVLGRMAPGSLVAVSAVPLFQMYLATENTGGGTPHISTIVYNTITYAGGSEFIIGGDSPVQSVLLLVREDSASSTVYEVISDTKGGLGGTLGIKITGSTGYGEASGASIPPLAGKSITYAAQSYIYKIATRTLRVDVTVGVAGKGKTGGQLLVRMIFQENIAGIWTDKGQEDFMVISNAFDAPSPGGGTITGIPIFMPITGTFMIYPSSGPEVSGQYRVILACHTSVEVTPMDTFYYSSKIKYVFHPLVV